MVIYFSITRKVAFSKTFHWVKSAHIRSFSDPDFPHSVWIRTRKTLNRDTIHAVFFWSRETRLSNVANSSAIWITVTHFRQMLPFLIPGNADCTLCNNLWKSTKICFLLNNIKLFFYIFFFLLLKLNWKKKSLSKLENFITHYIVFFWCLYYAPFLLKVKQDFVGCAVSLPSKSNLKQSETPGQIEIFNFLSIIHPTQQL